MIKISLGSKYFWKIKPLSYQPLTKDDAQLILERDARAARKALDAEALKIKKENRNV